MTHTVNISLTDYMKIAALVADNADDEPSTYEVEYTANGHTLFVEIDHDFDTRNVIGGSFEGYDFERLTEVYNETYDVVRFDCYDADGEAVTCDFTARRLLGILN